MKLKKTITVINKAIELKLTQPILSIVLMLTEYKLTPICEIAGILNNCQNNVGVTIKRMIANGLIEIHHETTKGANGHNLRQYTLTRLGKRTSATLLKDGPKKVMFLLNCLIKATNAGIGLLDLRIILMIAEANKVTVLSASKMLPCSATSLARRMNNMSIDGNLCRHYLNNANHYILSASGMDATLKILGIKTPATV